MIQIYSNEDFEREEGAKSKMLTIWWFAFAGVMAVCIALFVLSLYEPFESEMIKVYQVIVSVISCLFAAVSFLFFATKFRRQRRYVKMLRHVRTGLRDKAEGLFIRFDETLEQADGVDFHAMYVKVWNFTKQAYFERKVLLDVEKPLPKFSENDLIAFETQSNILVAFENKGEGVEKTARKLFGE